MTALVHWDVCTRGTSVNGLVEMLLLPCGACRECERNDGTWRTMNDASDIDSVTCPACLRVYMERRG